MIQPGTPAEHLVTTTLAAQRVRAERQRLAGDKTEAKRLSGVARATEAVIRKEFPRQARGLIQWAEMTAGHYLGGGDEPRLHRFLEPSAPAAWDDETAFVLEVVVEEPEPEPEPVAPKRTRRTKKETAR